MSQVQIAKILEGENLLKDISVTGCRVECTIVPDIHVNSQYKLKIEPEAISRINSFMLETECKWIRSDGYSTEVGFNIISSPKGRQFQNYVDYLAYRS